MHVEGVSLHVMKMESAKTEWVEIPQFSDGEKVYRVPFTKYDRGEKYSSENQDGSKFVEYPNASAIDENLHRRFKQQFGADRTTQSSLINVGSTQIVSTIKNVDFSVNGERFVTKNPDNNGDSLEDAFVEDEEEISTLTNIHVDDKIIVDGDQPYQVDIGEHFSKPEITKEEVPKPEDEENNGEKSFLAYIPLELFKRVHAILKSQSTTVEGKIEFMRNFEKSLLAEIEKRLVPVINPVRKKRESRGDHGWDDHDESIGFPSLEGALMSIAFLTFAVYLVQLVMMLFRNLGNNTNNPGTATVLFNRNKRSADRLNEDTARILDYLDKFVKNQTSHY